MTDRQLVAKAQDGDKQAFANLINKYERMIYNLAYRIIGNKEDASDILQDTFLQAYKKIVNFEGKSEFSTWLYRIAVNSALMRKRKEKNFHAVSMDKPLKTDEGEELKRQLKDDWSKEPMEILKDKELKETLDQAINKLPVKYKLPLILRDIQGFSNEEVSKILEISLAAVKSRVHRARMFLRDEISGYFSELQGAE